MKSILIIKCRLLSPSSWTDVVFRDLTLHTYRWSYNYVIVKVICNYRCCSDNNTHFSLNPVFGSSCEFHWEFCICLQIYNLTFLYAKCLFVLLIHNPWQWDRTAPLIGWLGSTIFAIVALITFVEMIQMLRIGRGCSNDSAWNLAGLLTS